MVRHADVKDVAQRSTVFKNAPHPILVPGADREGGGPPVRNLVGMDDEEHRIYRGLISEWFLPAAIRKRKTEIEAIAEERIEALSKGDSRIDFANVVSAGLPLRFINATLGIPPEDDALIHDWTSELFGIDDESVARSDRETTLEQVVNELGGYFMGLAGRLRAQPDDSLGSVLANAEIDGAATGAGSARAVLHLVVGSRPRHGCDGAGRRDRGPGPAPRSARPAPGPIRSWSETLSKR